MAGRLSSPPASAIRVARRSIGAVIFDLDGVIVDSEIWWDDVRKAFAADHGRSWTVDDRHAVMGANSRQWAETMRRRLDLDLPAADDRAGDRRRDDRALPRAKARRRSTAPSRRSAGSRAALPVALASSSHRAVIEAALAATGPGGHVPRRRLVRRGLPREARAGRLPRGRPAARRRARPDVLVVEDSLNGLRPGARPG